MRAVLPALTGLQFLLVRPHSSISHAQFPFLYSE